MLKKSLIINSCAKANDAQIKTLGNFRITAITPNLIRIEKSKNKVFTDSASTAVWNRQAEPFAFDLKESTGKLTITTPAIVLTVSKSTGSPEKVTFSETGQTSECRNFANLKGTRRTLDFTAGKVPIGDGLISSEGVATLDDSNSFLIGNDGMFTKREAIGSDIYVFAYGRNYTDAIKDFYFISSPVPIVPRYALGVWWSRYKAYSQDEYENLMSRFESENIPLTVATVDMDWHWTDLNKKFGTNYRGKPGTNNQVTGGWTGYSWNTDLFPDYKGFLKFLKDKDLHITLNLHPADGIRFFESMYPQVAKAMGVDPKSKKDIPFTCGSPDFWNTYFDKVLKPYEDDGVDFWWIDWQQGKKCDIKGLDPLIPLNHYHYLDNGESGKIPLILSRYSGPGAHRYPLGFSGDTMMNWAVLDFQPYFTATAANIGYTWWSHDIGGHHHGRRDDDLYVRWIQFGVFSPIMRLHSTSDDLLGKEPWMYSSTACDVAKKWLRLRHKMIPYIYSMDARTHFDGRALCEPMYYSYPNEQNAYDVKNQYMFGSELMVCPITTPQKKKTNYGVVRAWIPKGTWTDIFTLQKYTGPMAVDLNRDIDTIPILAKSGGIIPMSNDKGNYCGNPKDMELMIFVGDSSFTLYEDNGKTDFESHNAKTKFDISFDKEIEQLKFVINPVSGDTSVIPKGRAYTLKFCDLNPNCSVSLNGEEIEHGSVTYDKGVMITLNDYNLSNQTVIVIKGAHIIDAVDVKQSVINVMSRWQTLNDKKRISYERFKKCQTLDEFKSAMADASLPNAVASAMNEVLSEDR